MEREILSRGKEVLIKAIVQSIPTYMMGVFLLLARLCNELNALYARFWWGQTRDKEDLLEKLGGGCYLIQKKKAVWAFVT